MATQKLPKNDKGYTLLKSSQLLEKIRNGDASMLFNQEDHPRPNGDGIRIVIVDENNNKFVGTISSDSYEELITPKPKSLWESLTGRKRSKKRSKKPKKSKNRKHSKGKSKRK